MKLKMIPIEERIHGCILCGETPKYRVKFKSGFNADVCNTCALRHYDEFVDLSKDRVFMYAQGQIVEEIDL